MKTTTLMCDPSRGPLGCFASQTRGSWTVWGDPSRRFKRVTPCCCPSNPFKSYSPLFCSHGFCALPVKLTNSTPVRSAGLGPVVPLTSLENVLFFLFTVLLATAIVFLNASVFASIVLSRSLRGENRCMYMLSTCLSDVCSGVSYYYCGALDVRDSYDSPTRTFYIAPTFLGLSYMAILAAQADRYHAVAAPFSYTRRMTRGRTLAVVAAYWLYAFVIVAVNNLVTMGVAKTVTSIGTFVSNLFTVAIMIGLNVRLFLIARFQVEREPPSAERESKRASVYLIVLVSVCFLAAWLPIFLHIIVCNFTGAACYSFRNEGTDPLRVLPRLNAALTPLLYVRGCTALRHTLLTRVWRIPCKHAGVNPASGERSIAPSSQAVFMMHKT